MAIKRKCVCCGKEYEYCPNCMKKADPAWMTTFDSETCKDLFNIVSAYNIKKVNKARVQAFLAEHNITDFNKFSEPVKKVLAEIKPIVKENPTSVVIRAKQSIAPKPVVAEETINTETKSIPIEETLRDENVAKIVDEIPTVEKGEKITPPIESRTRSRRRKRRSGY